MLGGDNLISQPSLASATASHQNLAIANRGLGGGQLIVARPPPRPRHWSAAGLVLTNRV